MKSITLPLAVVAAFTFTGNAMAERSMHHIYHHHYKSMHVGADLGHRQHCIGRASGTAHRSCGTHTGGPSGGLH